MKATDAYRRINNSPIRGIVLYYTEQVLQSQKVPLKTVISEIQTGKTPPKSNSKYYSSNDIDWFKPSDIGFEKYLNNAKEKFAQIALDEKKGTLYPKDTLLLIGIGGGVGRVSILKEAGSSNQQITGVTFNNDVSSEYAYYYYLVREDYIKSQAKSMSFPILNQTKIKGLEINYPSIEEQDEFVGFVDYCWSSYLNNEIPNVSDFNVDEKLKIYTLTQFKAIELDSKIKANIAYQKQQITDLKQAILQEAIQGKLTQEWREQNPATEPASELLEHIKAEKEQLIKNKKIRKEKPLPPIIGNEIPFVIPNNWIWCILDEVTLFKNGKAHEQFVDADGKYVLINSKFVSTNGEKVKYTGNLMMPMFVDEIAIVMSDVPNGRALSRCFIIDENDKYSLNQRIGGIVPINGIFPKYLLYLLDRNKHYLSFNDGKKQTNLKKSQIMSCPIPLPPFEEQKAIVEKIESLMQKCNALEQEITQSEQHANMLMQAVLKEAFESKIEQETEVVKLNSKPTNIDYYKRTLLATEIVWQLHKEPTLGHLKLQKLMYLAQEAGNMQLPTNFLQQVAGPYDPQMARSLDKQMKTKKWFEYKKTEMLKFKPLEKAGEHKPDFEKFFANEKESIHYIIDTFKTAKSDQVEIVGTLYACWNKLIDEKQIISDELLTKRFYEWSKEKVKFEKNRIIKALRWMEKKGIIPEYANA